jgi:hypothetical protein
LAPKLISLRVKKTEDGLVEIQDNRSRYEKVSDSKSSEIEDDIRDLLEEDSVSQGDTGENVGILGDIVLEYDLEEKCSTPINDKLASIVNKIKAHRRKVKRKTKSIHSSKKIARN